MPSFDIQSVVHIINKLVELINYVKNSILVSLNYLHLYIRVQGKAYSKHKILKLIRPWLSKGLSVNKACQFIGLDSSVITKWCNLDPNLSKQLESYRHDLSKVALINVSEAINNGIVTRYGIDKYTPSKEYLETIERDEFGKQPTIEQNVNIGLIDNTSLTEKLKALASKSGLSLSAVDTVENNGLYEPTSNDNNQSGTSTPVTQPKTSQPVISK